MKKNGRKKRIKVGRGIKAKLLFGILPLVAISLAVVIFTAHSMAKNSLVANAEQILRLTGTSASNEISGWLAECVSGMKTITYSILNENMNEEETRTYLENILGADENFPDGMYMATADGILIDGSGWEPGYDPSESDWYISGQSHDDFYFIEPYIDALTGQYVVTAVRKADWQGKVATIACDIRLGTVTEEITAIQVGENGEAFMIDGSSGTILAHRDSALVGVAIDSSADQYYQEIYSQIKENSTDIHTEEDSAGVSYMSSIEPIEGTSWYVVSRIPESEVMAALISLQKILYGIGMAAVIVICLFIERILHTMLKPVKRITQSIVDVTDGDFSQDIITKGGDEIALMGRSMQEFILTMRGIIGSLASISNTLDQKSAASNVLSANLHKSAGSQSEAMVQLSRTVEELVRAIMDIAENATSLAQIVDVANKDGVSAMETMSETKDAADEGRRDMNQVNDAMKKIQGSMQLLGESIGDVGKAAVKIDEITNTISNIAEETNLLALNASIEAARAGDAGKGFAVVASEIKKLAETSASAAEEISQLINSVTGLISTTVSQSQENMEEIVQSSDLVDTACVTFDRIYNSIHATNETVKDMIEKVKEVDDVATSVAAITEEQSASAQEIEATSVEITDLAKTVADNSKAVSDDSAELEQNAKELQKEISIFKI